eukprot:scaffold177_cov334-Pavlova_lutheri.AAC.106
MFMGCFARCCTALFLSRLAMPEEPVQRGRSCECDHWPCHFCTIFHGGELVCFARGQMKSHSSLQSSWSYCCGVPKQKVSLFAAADPCGLRMIDHTFDSGWISFVGRET